MKLKRLYSFLISVLVFSAGIFLFCGFYTEKRLPSRSVIDGVFVGRMTEEQAKNAIICEKNQLLKDKVLSVFFNGKKEFTLSFPQIRYEIDDDKFSSAVQGRAEKCTFISLIDEERVVDEICAFHEKTAKDAVTHYSFSGVLSGERDKLFSFEDEQNGVECDRTLLLKDIKNSLLRFDDKNEFSPVELKTRTTYAKVNRQTAEKYTQKIASFSTKFSTALTSRVHNITLACRKIDGTIVKRGKSFSFNNVVGERTKKNGFLSATIISGGEFTSGVGGGVCQVSTTIYNCAILANMRIDEHHAHSLSVAYVEPSFDAMVNSGSADMRFTNTGDSDVYIHMYVKGGELFCHMYGKDSGVRVERQSVVSEIISPPSPLICTGDNECVVRKEKNGMKSHAYVILSKNGKVISKKKIRSDEYAYVRGIIRAENKEGGD